MSVLIMPKGGIQTSDGKLTPAGHSLLSELTRRNSAEPANSAEKLMAGGKGNVTAEAVWSVMRTQPTLGGGDWTPDLRQGLHFKRQLAGPTRILFPVNVPRGKDGPVEPYFSVWVMQNSVGGWPVSYGPGFWGQPPVIKTGANEMTLIGFNVFSNDPPIYTAWAVKGVP